MGIDLILIRADDWESLYWNGDLMMQTHIIDLADALRMLSTCDLSDFCCYSTTEAGDNYLYNHGRWPSTFDEIAPELIELVD